MMAIYENLASALIKRAIRIFGPNRYFRFRYKFGGWISNRRMQDQFEHLDYRDGIAILNYKTMHYFLNVRPIDFIESTTMLKGVWEKENIDAIDCFLQNKSSGVFVDIGANVGAVILPLAKMHPKLRFVCIEPNPAVAARLKSNISINQLKNVDVVKKLCSKESGRKISFKALQYSENAINMGESSTNTITGDFDQIEVETTTLDDLLKNDYPNQSVLGIKIDVQGHENEVLEGAPQTFATYKPFVICEFESFQFEKPHQAATTMAQFFSRFGYSLFAVNGNVHNFKPRLELNSNFCGDFLAVPNPSLDES